MVKRMVVLIALMVSLLSSSPARAEWVMTKNVVINSPYTSGSAAKGAYISPEDISCYAWVTAKKDQSGVAKATVIVEVGFQWVGEGTSTAGLFAWSMDGYSNNGCGGSIDGYIVPLFCSSSAKGGIGTSQFTMNAECSGSCYKTSPSGGEGGATGSGSFTGNLEWTNYNCYGSGTNTYYNGGAYCSVDDTYYGEQYVSAGTTWVGKLFYASVEVHASTTDWGGGWPDLTASGLASAQCNANVYFYEN